MEVNYNNGMIDYDEEQALTFDFEPALEQQEEDRRRFFADQVPKRKDSVVCKYWLRGICHKNESVRFFVDLESRKVTFCI